MAEIRVGKIRMKDHFTGDAINVSFQISGINLTGKTLFCQVRETIDSAPVAEFREDDSTLNKTINSTVLTTVQLVRLSTEPKIPVLPITIPITPYILTIISFTSPSDIQTIVEGTLIVREQPSIYVP